MPYSGLLRWSSSAAAANAPPHSPVIQVSDIPHVNYIHLHSLLSLNTTALPISVGTMSSSDRSGWRSSPDGRGTLNIIWSCLFTVFICCWTASHPDIPRPGSSWTKRALDKIVCLLVAAIAPEFLVFIALCEWAAARDSRRKRDVSGDTPGWSVVHHYYANMGGFCMQWKDDADGSVKMGFLDGDQVATLLHQNEISDSAHLSREAIEDRGKADWLVKVLALLQMAWLVIQCVARVGQKLPLTTLELSTLAYIPCALLIFYLWWDKPYDIGQPTMVFFKDQNHQRPIQIVGGSKALAYMSGVDRPRGTIIRQYQNFPMTRNCIDAVQSCFFRIKSFSIASVFVGIFYAIFGGIHCAAWNFPFPTKFEQLAWRVCSIILAISIPASWLLTRLVMICLECGTSDTLLFGSNNKARVRVKLWPFSSRKFTVSGVESIQAMGAIAYALARMYLIFEVFFNLRDLPATCYDTVSWSDYLPHI
ncbi:hypothetical protein BKA63DRAFT_506520 [Paraphoma chrysanthemicola]|nr:hypothetical protein BKA63DRAFT_506520 [Paraphoma chrysanthemicola]